MEQFDEQLISRLSEIKNRSAIDLIVDQALLDHKLYKSLLNSIFHKNEQIAMRAAWAISHCAEKDIKLVQKDKKFLLKTLWEIDSESIKRSITKSLSLMPLCDEMDGIFFDKCIDAILSRKTAIANKAYLIDIVLKYTKTYPELAAEVIIVLDTIKEGASKGITGKVRNSIKILSTLQANL